MKNRELNDCFLALVQLGIGHSPSFKPEKADWEALRSLAAKHELAAVVLDGIDKSPELTANLPKPIKMQWIGQTLLKVESRYTNYKKAIRSLARFYNRRGFKMMVLKGYACSLNWPKPEHRPAGDIDIWLFGEQQKADDALRQAAGQKFKIDETHHHHTVFCWHGFVVENHYDFLNVHHHKSNVELESILKELGQDDSHYVEIEGERIYIPSANLHALFLLRHSMSNFASTGFHLRHLLDWAFFAEKHREEIDWAWLENQLEHFGMKKLYDIFNAISVEDLGFDIRTFSRANVDRRLKERVLNDILSPEFDEKETGGFVKRAIFKYRRWKANGWKHELCFSESMLSAFWSGVWSHLLKPASV